MSCTVYYTPQEEMLNARKNGEAAPERAAHRRLDRIAKKFVGTTPYIDIERGILFTESMKQTEGQPLVLRWARALEHIARNITVYVDDDQLLAGRCGTDQGRYGILYPELDGDFFGGVLESVADRPDLAWRITPEEVRRVQEEITPYWAGKTLHEDIVKTLEPEIRRMTYKDPEGREPRFITVETGTQRGGTTWCLDYDKILNRGMKSIRQEAAERMATVPEEDTERRAFYEAVMITCDALVTWSRRHADLARVMAAAEPDPRRRQELQKIAEHCAHVPEHPARTFHEAMQAQWLAQAFSRFEHRTGGLITNGRMDQYLYPFYKRDKEAGILTDNDVLELLDCLWVNIGQFIDISITPVASAMQGGYAAWETVCIGGQDRLGHDATNDLSYLILQSRKESPLVNPDLAVRIHSRTPDRFLHAIAETIKIGQGFPKLSNDEDIVPYFTSRGASRADSMDYTHSGCTEIRIPNLDTNTTPCVHLNLGAVMELTLYNGRLLKYPGELMTIETGDPAGFATWEEFFEAFKKQYLYCLQSTFTIQKHTHRLRGEHFATPLASGLHNLCMEHGVDLQSSRHLPGSVDCGFFDVFGYATLVDSLSAIRKQVYDDRALTMAELLEALKANFEGHEETRMLLSSSPAYGNNDPYADELGLAVDTIAQEYCIAHEKALGHEMGMRMVTVTGNVAHGTDVSASPNGRLAFTPVSDGSSTSHGVESHGPTGVLLSNHYTKNYGLGHYASRLLNIKLSPGCVRGEKGTRDLMALIRTWCDLHLWHVQFNIINRETLVKAQENPDDYRHLIVRVAGYSAYFTDLSRAIQDDIISRTELDL